MDFIKDAASKVSGGNKEGSSSNAASGGQSGGQKDDYGDKAFAFASKKSGQNIDRDTQEKITDGARNAYEKATGNKVDPKYSN